MSVAGVVLGSLAGEILPSVLSGAEPDERSEHRHHRHSQAEAALDDCPRSVPKVDSAGPPTKGHRSKPCEGRP